jgi:uncharacterized protein (TIGR02271 family)
VARFERRTSMGKEMRKENTHLTITQQMLVAVFDDRTQAERAVTELERAGFSRDQIEFTGQGAAPAGGFLAELKSLFTGQASATGGISNDFVKLGMPAEDAAYFQREYEAGHSILAVSGDSHLDEAQAILVRYGGHGPRRPSTEDTASASTASATAQQTAEDTEESCLRLRAEQLQAYKRSVETGEVRLHKEVVAEQKTLNIPVTHEEVYLERRPVSGQFSETPIGEGETIRVPVHEEQVQTSKQTVETGEVVLGKRQVQETQQVSDTVRHEEARLERSGEVEIPGSDIQARSERID